MSLYLVIAVRFDANGEVKQVKWRAADGARNAFTSQPAIVGVDRIVEAFNRGDVVELWFDTPDGRVSGPRLRAKVLPSGFENVVEEFAVAGRMLRDLPTF